MINIKLPSKFESKLSEDQFLEGVVKMTFSKFGDIYKDNKLYFFEEYTDHGLDHLIRVLASAENLITKDTFENIITGKDVGYLVLSVLLHDIGMHINLNGFKYLIKGGMDSIRVKELDGKTWSELWNDFLNDAKRFSGKTLKAIFGNENLVIRIPPLEEAEEINGYDKKLIGEFIRKNHARLAHEIAVHGFPGNDDLIKFAEGIDLKDRNLVGLIARSHGIDLRTCLDYIEFVYGRNNRRFPSNVHASFLMVLLRLADYIQIDKSRTSNTIIKTKKFSSPISAIEHAAHISINAIDDKYQDDPEKIFVEAYPVNSKMYLKLKNLIKDIQFEFDMSWAVLGELYGRIDDRPEIKYRRISSNLSEELFISKQEYVADYFSFKANDEIVKLLIAPLYGNDPRYGIRELLQNATDACKERQHIEWECGNSKYNPTVDIIVTESEFSICDNGIGMDVNVIKNYFLKAGASYRKSLEWQKKYVDNSGHVVVQRSGRFGVGILAAFLIGDIITLETKRNGSKYGYRFSANLNVDQINLIKDEGIPEGTKISIKINEEVLKMLEPKKFENAYKAYTQWFEWFTLKSPLVNYYFLGSKLIPYRELNPALNMPLPKQWTEVNSEGFNKLHWRYATFKEQPTLTCNGIIITDCDKIPSKHLDLGLISHEPYLNVFDYDAFLPLTLNREAFSDRIPFERSLKESLYKDYIAYLLTFKNVSLVDRGIVYLNEQRLGYPGTKAFYMNERFSYGFNIYDEPSELNAQGSELLENLLISQNGFIVNYNFFIQKLNGINAILIQSENLKFDKGSMRFDLKDRFLYYSDSSIGSIHDYVSAIEPKVFDRKNNIQELYNSRIFIKSERFEYLFHSDKKRTSLSLRQRIEVIYNKNGWVGFHLDHGPDFVPNVGATVNTLISSKFLKRYESINFIREHKIECRYEGDKVLNSLLQKYIGDDVLIPYSIEERKKKFPLAFKDLQVYMEKYIKE